VGGEALDLPLFCGQRMRAELRDNLASPCGMDKPARTVHHVIERISSRKARKNNVRPLADCGRRSRRRAADFFKLGKRAAPIAENLVSRRKQMFRDFGSDPADPDKADDLHVLPPRYWVQP